jgi:Glu-tRNA(Gln) amidotransferase subunit E-like FAD-binding protein
MRDFNIKCGLEIHQQLDTSKLFCNCPSVLRNDKPDFEFKRRLHAVAGEGGEIDIAAKHEVEKDREFVYQGYDTVCLVEMDEEPPHLINTEALEIALHISLLLNCEILPISQIMRKTVVDGSNTSGFQRTVLIARNGYVETKEGRVRIGSIYLEEDAARPVKEGGESDKFKVYRLDRLGIPLVEIQTEADIKSKEQAKETALLIGDILRSCKVKRGIGTIRQDINISIRENGKEHPRVEIKGFQDAKMFIPIIENEIKRQSNNLQKGKSESEVRNALDNGNTEFLRPMPGSARMYPETDLPLLRISRDILNRAKEFLPKLRSEIRGELEKRGLTDEQIQILFRRGLLEEFEVLLKIIDDSRFIFKVLIEIPVEIARHKGKSREDIENLLSLDIIESIVQSVKSSEINRGDVKSVMEDIVSGKRFEEAIRIERADEREIEEEIVKIIKEKPGLNRGGYMGLIMGKFKGKIEGKRVSEILDKLINP